MKISNKAIELIKQFEGIRLKAYLDSTGIPTIGYGHTKNVKIGDTCTQAQAEQYLSDDISRIACPTVNKYNSVYNFSQNEYDALCVFAFNIGSIDGLTADGTRSIGTIANMILEYNKAKVNGVLSPVTGLTKRRQAEHDLFVSDSAPSYEIGLYKLTNDLKVRTNAGVAYQQKNYNELTLDAQKHASKNGILLSGTIVTVKQIVNEGSNIWGRTPSGYIALYYNNESYVQKV